MFDVRSLHFLGLCANCNGSILRHVRVGVLSTCHTFDIPNSLVHLIHPLGMHEQINGARLGAPSMLGGGNIEMGASNSDQLIEYVKSFDPRGWTCLHVIEGALDCTNTTVRFNDIGEADQPCLKVALLTVAFLQVPAAMTRIWYI